jgi:hypothetical protein
VDYITTRKEIVELGAGRQQEEKSELIRDRKKTAKKEEFSIYTTMQNIAI